MVWDLTLTKEQKTQLAKERQQRGTKRTYVSKPRCAAIWRNTGEQCIDYAVEGTRYCGIHGNGGNGAVPGTPMPPAAVAGLSEYWKRIKAEAAKDPTLLSRIHNPHHTPEHMAKLQAARAAAVERRRAGLPPLPKPPKPTADEKLALKADKIITAELATLPAVPDKPFEELEPHEQLVVVTGQALQTVHEILAMPIKDAEGNVNMKAATLKKDTAIRTLSIRVKVDTNALNARRQDKTLDLLEKIREEQARGVKVIEG